MSLRCIPGIFVLAAGCTESPGGPEYASLAIEVENTSGAETERHCSVLPVLPGGRLEQDLRIGGAFTIHLSGTRDELRVTFTGVDDAEANRRHYLHSELRGQRSDTATVTTAGGEEFYVIFTAPCPVDP